mmetsp:Transcript_26837/g.58535  ORF Transcript_26837/g.58535 Transcript_26837/m.58535 type:complete len:301 (-) Transcript_26837:2035-2937(-)
MPACPPPSTALQGTVLGQGWHASACVNKLQYKCHGQVSGLPVPLPACHSSQAPSFLCQHLCHALKRQCREVLPLTLEADVHSRHPHCQPHLKHHLRVEARHTACDVQRLLRGARDRPVCQYEQVRRLQPRLGGLHIGDCEWQALRHLWGQRLPAGQEDRAVNGSALLQQRTQRHVVHEVEHTHLVGLHRDLHLWADWPRNQLAGVHHHGHQGAGSGTRSNGPHLHYLVAGAQAEGAPVGLKQEAVHRGGRTVLDRERVRDAALLPHHPARHRHALDRVREDDRQGGSCGRHGVPKQVHTP